MREKIFPGSITRKPRWSVVYNKRENCGGIGDEVGRTIVDDKKVGPFDKFETFFPAAYKKEN